jgi:hypothetical protein
MLVIVVMKLQTDPRKLANVPSCYPFLCSITLKNQGTAFLFGSRPCRIDTTTALSLEALLAAVTRPNDRLYDPFVGEGRTALAALLTKRAYMGIERERVYWRGAILRLERQLQKENYNE